MKSKFKSRTSWREKLEKPQEAKLVKVPSKMARFGGGMMLIPTPKLVDDLIRKIPTGKLFTVGEMRKKLAADFAADVTCPLTTGIFVRIAAEAAEEAAGQRRGAAVVHAPQLLRGVVARHCANVAAGSQISKGWMSLLGEQAKKNVQSW